MSHPVFPAAGAASRYSAKNNTKPVNFICVAPDARHVSVVGDFNQWDAAAHPMKRQPDGAWFAQVGLTHGPHHYQFCVDGKLVLDPRAQGIARNARNERVSLITIS